jgi:site-specific DNA recombinase
MRTALYVRQSLDSNGEGAAVARQERECRALARRNGWEITAVYSDNDQSATNGKRPEWHRLLADLDQGLYDVLLCWHTDRLYRRLRDLVALLEIAERHQLRIVAVQAGDLDLSTASGRMVAAMLGSVASYEGQHKSERQKAANVQRASAGLVRWARRPYGFAYDEQGRVVVVKDEAREIRRAAKKILAGASLTTVVGDLNRRGVVNSLDRHGCDNPDECPGSASKCPQVIHGSTWNQITLSRVLTSPRTAGRAVSNGVDYGKAPHPAILDAATHDALVAKLADPRRRNNPGNPWQAKHLLSGIALCGICGAVLHSFQPSLTRQYPGRLGYRCSAVRHLNRRVVDVDNVVERTMIARLSRRDAAKLFSPDVDVDALRGKRVELAGRRDEISALLREGLISADSARRDLGQLTEQIKTLDTQIANATMTSPLGDSIGTSDVRRVWNDELSLGQKRSLIDLLATITVLPAGRGIGFQPEQVQITWKR